MLFTNDDTFAIPFFTIQAVYYDKGVTRVVLQNGGTVVLDGNRVQEFVELYRSPVSSGAPALARRDEE